MGANKFILRKLKSINNERYNKHVEVIHKNTGKSKFFIKMDIIKNFITRGAGYTDYFRGNYINISKENKKTFVTAKSFYKIIKYLNNEKYIVLLNNKLVFNKFFKEYLKRDYINLNIASLEDFKKFIKNKKIVFAKKPIGEGGHEVEKIVLKDYKDKKGLYNDLIKKGEILVEEAIKQSKELNEINPNVVNSFRIITLYKDGKVYILNNSLRINQDNSEIIGCTNDLYFSLDENGKISSNVIDDYGNVYLEHPLTNKKFSEVKIKGVKEAFEMCKKAALEIPEIRYIGWDVAFTDDGPLIVEGNEYPGYGIIQHFKLNDKKTGHLKEISDILKEEMNNIK